ncbi:MAG: serine/threonine-protein kinase, partial [Myxococcota bacterium]
MDRLIDGRYRVTQELASGGMGVVLLAEDEQAGTEVAIKVVRGDLANSAEAVARFRREMKVLATLDSPRIVTAYEAGSVSGMPFLVMERLRGQGLDDLLDECGPLPLARAIDIAIELLEALADAHAAGVVHRDLKPSNIWLTPGGDLKLLDFGVAKMRTEAPADGYETTGILTGTGAVLGSPAYMAPEQLVSSKEADERADLWSVGVILYELVTGRLLFEAKTVGGVFANVLQMPIPPLRHVHPG